VFELLIMFWEDYYRKNPMESRRTEDGKVVFANTGDALIDKWERELAMGLTPDLLEGMSQEERAAEARALEKLKEQHKAVGAEGLISGFSDNYLDRQNLPALGKK
jgi:hypothetical protein